MQDRIEKRAREYDSLELNIEDGEYNSAAIVDAFCAGANFALSEIGWRSVEDELPNYNDGLVIVRVSNKNKEDGISLYDVCYIDEESNTWGKRIHTWENITHWMSIPELKKGE